MWNSDPYMMNYNRGYSRMEVIKVNGENGARAYNMPPNSSALLLDETAPIVWLKTTDGAGYATLNPFSITPYEPAPAVDINDLVNRIARLEERLNEKPSNAVSKRRKSEPDESSEED